jgi:putative endonuclease
LSSPRTRESFVIPANAGIFCHSRERGNLWKIMKGYYIYILSNKKRGTLYTGITSNLIKRIYEHKNDLVPGFTQKYNLHKLVYYEKYDDVLDAITREKRIKKWERQWKIELIENFNADWKDLYYEIT